MRRNTTNNRVLYPVKEVTLPAVWEDICVSLRAVSDIFGYQYFIVLDSGLVIMAEPAQAEVTREVAVSDGIVICADATGQKSLELIIDNAQVLVGAAIDPDLNKPVVAESGVAISAHIRCTDRRYRNISELAGLTLADVSDWTLDDIYYLEV